MAINNNNSGQFVLPPPDFTTKSLVLHGQTAFFSLSLGREEKKVWSSSNPTIVLTCHELMSQ